MKSNVLPLWLKGKMAGITHFRLLFTDILGGLKEMSITSDEIYEVLELGQGFDGSSIQGFVRLEESDLMAIPRLKSFRVLPAEISGINQPVGIFFCDIRKPNGQPFPGDPRQCLKRILKKAKRLGYTFYVGPEIEFFVFKDENTPIPLDHQGYFDSAGNLAEEIVDVLKKIGIRGECSHHEVAPSQFEIDVKYQEALTMADQVMLIRWVAKKVAKKHGLYITFFPKPIFGENGSGMHTHMSLFTGDRNAFFNPTGSFNLSRVAKYFIGGLMRHAQEFCVVTNQLVNSYKRILPGYEAPCYISYGSRNRSSLIRIPGYRLGKEKATRVELRSPDPTCNPYLAFATMLAAGLDGIAQKIRPGRPIEENVFEMSLGDHQKNHIKMLPGSLKEAIQIAQKSTFLRHALGLHIFKALLNNKNVEWEDYRTHISTWEINHLMSRY
ncbi:MAG: glutamine synthetase family protein [Patescibacteria group bacterium]|jgi:glutamine synthetase